MNYWHNLYCTSHLSHSLYKSIVSIENFHDAIVAFEFTTTAATATTTTSRQTAQKDSLTKLRCSNHSLLSRSKTYSEKQGERDGVG